MSQLRLFIPIGKVDEAQRLVYGTLTEETPDKSGEIFDYASGKPAVQAWSDEIKAASKGKSLGNVRAMHGNTAAGKFTNIQYDDANKRIEGAAKIVDDDEWEKVLAGVYTGFSIGGAYTKRWQDPNNSSLWRFTPKLSEISLVDNPCVPTATFEYIKADGSVEMRKFHTPTHEDSMDPKALVAAKEALVKGTATDEQKALIKADADKLLKEAQEAEAAGTATDEQKALIKAAVDAVKPELVKDGKPVKPKSAPVQKNVWLASDGSEHASKREAEIYELHLEKKAELAPGLAQMDALLKGAKKPEEDEDEDKDGDDEDTKKAKKARREEKAAKAKEKAEKDDAEMAAKAKEKADAEKAKKDKEKEEAEKAAAAAALQKKEYTDKEREEMADKKEALPDGSFPIKTKKDLENAVESFGRAKDKDKAKAHIMARAKALDAEDMLPKAWTEKKKSTPKTGLAKGLHQVGWLAHMLDELTRFQDSVEIEQYFEDDKDSELPAKLKSIVSEFCDLLITLVEEETSELAEGDDTDVEVLEMAAGLPAGHADAIAKAARAKAEPLNKSDSKAAAATGAKLVKFAEAMEKAGARHSKADADRVQVLHDHADEMHKCMGEMIEKCADMHKAAGESKNTAIDLGAKGDTVDDEDDMEPASKSAVKMSKVLDALAESKTESGALTKVIGTMDSTLREAVELIKGQKADIEAEKQKNAELTKRMEHLEGQPMPGKGHVRVVSKTQDGGDEPAETEAKYNARVAKLTPGQKAREAMIKSMANPMALSNL